jgi:hypothetical protein
VVKFERLGPSPEIYGSRARDPLKSLRIGLILMSPHGDSNRFARAPKPTLP